MGGVVGGVFHEFAIVIGMAILVSGFVSLTLTPMLCSRFLRPHGGHEEEGLLARILERGVAAMPAGYERSLRFVLRHSRLTIGLPRRPLPLTVSLCSVFPKSLLPTDSTGLLTAGAV